MTARSLLGSAKAFALRIPPLRAFTEGRYERAFLNPDLRLHRGVFETFGEARASAPRQSQVGFDVKDAIVDFADRFERVFAYDYPMLFWLGRIFQSSSSVFDWGGHLGIHYHAYRKFLDYPVGLRWTVCEVPTLAVEGSRRFAPSDAGLFFTRILNSADGYDVLIANGSLQYVENPSLAGLLSSLKRQPAHLLVNKIPLHDGPTFFTLQNIGYGFAPVHVWNRDSFLRDLTELGYRLIDSWDVPERTLRLPHDPEHSLERFSGIYLQRTSAVGHQQISAM